jgi:ribose transport system permease protein
MTTAPLERQSTAQDRLSQMARSVFAAVGILPLLMVAVIIIFASQEARFYGTANITNVLRQSTFLIIVTLGQALVLISGGFDLSVGAVIAVTSVITARYMSNFYAANPESELMALVVGVAAGLVVGLVFCLV